MAEWRGIFVALATPFNRDAADIDEATLRRLAVKFGRSLKVNEELYDYIAKVKAWQASWKHFDFEPSLDEAETLTTPDELRFYMHWLKARGRQAHPTAGRHYSS